MSLLGDIASLSNGLRWQHCRLKAVRARGVDSPFWYDGIFVLPFDWPGAATERSRFTDLHKPYAHVFSVPREILGAAVREQLRQRPLRQANWWMAL